MEKAFKIELNYKNHFSFGIHNSGYDLLQYLYLENLTENSYENLKITVKTTPEILPEGERVVDFVAPLGYRYLSLDFVDFDKKSLLGINFVTDVCICVLVSDERGELLSRAEFSCKFIPYDYFSGLGDMPETLAFFITPEQGELSQIVAEDASSDALDYCQLLYQNIKNLQITFSGQDYSGSTPLQVRLCERVLREKTANPLELSLLFASACERGGFSPILAFVGKGKVYAGICLRQKPLPILSYFERGKKDFTDLHFIDGSFLAYGSELSFDLALFNSKNNLTLTDDKILILDVSSARKLNLMPLPNRIQQGTKTIFSQQSEASVSGGFEEFFALTKQYGDNPLISAILTGKKLKGYSGKYSIPFLPYLDVNQNKILSKILGNEFTLIRAAFGGGATTVFAAAAEHALKNQKSVLYITDEKYNSQGYRGPFSDFFHESFIFDLTGEEEKCNKDSFEGFFQASEQSFENRSALTEALERLDAYYEHLEGEKRIVSSFLFASDRYHQLRDAKDSIVFSPEQIGTLSDEMVQIWFSSVNDLVKSFGEVGTVCSNPLLLIREKAFSYEFKSKLIRQLEEILHSIESIMALRDQIAGLFSSVESIRTFHGFYAFQDLIRLFSEFSVVPESFFEEPGKIEDNFRKATHLVQAKKENDSILETILISFENSIFELDATDLYTRYQNLLGDKGFKAISQKYGILKTVKRYLRPNCDVENVEYILSRLNTYQQNAKWIEGEKEAVFRLLSVPNTDDPGAWERLQVASDLCYQAYSVFQNGFSLESLSDFVSDFKNCSNNDGVLEKLAQLRQLSEDYIGYKDALEKTVGNQLDFFYPQASSREADYFAVIHNELSSVFSEIDHLKNWCNWLGVREDALRIGLKNIVNAIEAGKIQAEDLKRSFLRAFFKGVCEYNFILHPELVPESFDFDACMSDYCRAVSEDRENARTQMNTVLSLRRFDALSNLGGDPFYPMELYRNDPACFLDVFPVVVSDIKTAKKEFSSQKDLFDFIFIESRTPISLSDFLWTLYSGKKVAFAGALSLSDRGKGDSFDLSNSAFDYLWKISEEKYSLSAVYNSDPNITALKQEFAQAARSDFRVYTAPAPSFTPSSHWERVAGSFNTEYPGANFAEAQFCAEAILRFAEKEEKKSLGIVTSTLEQKNLVLRLLAQKLRQMDERENLADRFERFSVFTTEDDMIVSDEIIFSVTYAPDRSLHGARLPFSLMDFGDGDPYMRFFKVLSSAKRHITVLTSFGIDELRFSPSVLPVVSALNLLLRVVNAPQKNHTYSLVGTFDNDSVIKRIKSELEVKGYSTLAGVHSGRYYIDLAVLNQDGEAVLGIISDQTVMNQKANIPAIEAANASFYESCGWHLYRLRSPKVFDSFETEMENILSVLSPGGEETELI